MHDNMDQPFQKSRSVHHSILLRLHSKRCCQRQSDWRRALAESSPNGTEPPSPNGTELPSPNGTEPPSPNKPTKMSDVEQKKVVKTTNKRKGRDDKAPRNISAYSVFAKEFREAGECDGLSLSDMSKKLSAAWKTVSDKSKYEQAAEEYNKNIVNDKKMYKKKDNKKDTGDVEKKFRGTTAYIQFAIVTRSEVSSASPQLIFAEVSKEVGALWKALDEEDKKKWSDIADEKNKKKIEEAKETESSKEAKSSEEAKETESSKEAEETESSKEAEETESSKEAKDHHK